MKHPLPDRVKPSFAIFDIWALWHSAGLSIAEHWRRCRVPIAIPSRKSCDCICKQHVSLVNVDRNIVLHSITYTQDDNIEFDPRTDMHVNQSINQSIFDVG